MLEGSKKVIRLKNRAQVWKFGVSWKEHILRWW